MRASLDLVSLAAGAASVFLLFLALGLQVPAHVAAEDTRPNTSAPCTCTCPESQKPPGLWPRPKYAELKASRAIAAIR
jgi:hypothetical protein